MYLKNVLQKDTFSHFDKCSSPFLKVIVVMTVTVTVKNVS